MDLIEKNSLKLAENFKDCSSSDEISNLMKQYLNDITAKNLLFDAVLPYENDEIWLNTLPLSEGDVSGKVVLLDFFTYCCINCIHIIPFLHKIEAKYSIADGLLVIGVHSAKFPNEKVSDNIVNALKRYQIQHAVINDFSLDLWNKFSVKCWPTLIVLSPHKQVLLSLPGETHTSLVEALISEAMKFYKSSLSNHEIIHHSEINKLNACDQLKFPGKIAINKTRVIFADFIHGLKVNFNIYDKGHHVVITPSDELPINLEKQESTHDNLAISDTGNHRILITTVGGDVLHVVGCGKPGCEDGQFSTCMFKSPQGVVFYGTNTIFVADCDNHVIRKIDLSVKRVVTITGTGLQGNDLEGGQKGIEQVLCSPWDVVVAGSPQFPEEDNILYIAMSGIHQIWAFFLEDSDWQKGTEYKLGTCLRFAGNGQEENRNNSYPHKAGFAQPSGLSVDRKSNKLFVADSESSTVRSVRLSNGAVEALVGGHFDPTNLFAFGDVDGKARNAKLQHPLAVAWDSKRSRLYVADSYNNKIKMVDPSNKVCVTLCGPASCEINDESLQLSPVFAPVNLNEPGGLCIDKSCKHLFIADTNSCEIKILALESGDYSVVFTIRGLQQIAFVICLEFGRCFRSHELADQTTLWPPVYHFPLSAFSKLRFRFPYQQNTTVTDSIPAKVPLTYQQLVNEKTALQLRHDHIETGRSSFLNLSIRADGIHLTDQAPSSWQLSASLRTNQNESSESIGEFILIQSEMFSTSNAEFNLKVSISDLLPLLLRKLDTDTINMNSRLDIQIKFEGILYYCLDETQLCMMKGVVGIFPLGVDLQDTKPNIFDATLKFSLA